MGNIIYFNVTKYYRFLIRNLHQDDKLSYTIYNCNWYTYDLESQRIIWMLLRESQKSKEIKLGSIGTLNLVTGIQVYRFYFCHI